METKPSGPGRPPGPNLHLYDPDSPPCDDAAMPAHDQSGATVREIIDWFLLEYTSTSAPALKEIRRILRLFIDCHGDKPVSMIGGNDLREFVKSQPHVRKPNTVARWYRAVKMAFNGAVKVNKIPRSPFILVKLPKGDEGRDLTTAEFQTLLRMTTPVFRRVLIFLRYCGARPQNLRMATWDHIRWGEECTTLVFKEHKTAHATGENLTLYMPVPLVKLLLWLRKNTHGTFIFTNSFGGQWKTDALCKRIRKIRKSAGFDSTVRLYGCRHTFATQAIINKTDLAEVKELMNHRSVKTTLRYVHLANKGGHMFNAVEKAIGRKPKHDEPLS